MLVGACSATARSAVRGTRSRKSTLTIVRKVSGWTIPQIVSNPISGVESLLVFTSGAGLVDALRTQPRPVNVWITIEPFWIGVEKRPFLERLRYDLRILADYCSWLSHKCWPTMGRPQILHSYSRLPACVFKFCRKKFTLAARFRKKIVENAAQSQNAVEIRDFSLGIARFMQNRRVSH